MNKKNLVIIFLLITTIVFLALFIYSSNASQYTDKSHIVTLLNHEANEFSLGIALAYCNESDSQTILIYNCKDIEQPEMFASAEKTIKNISLTKYVSDTSWPMALYYIDYKTDNGDYIRQKIEVTKNYETGQWMCEVLGYEQINE